MANTKSAIKRMHTAERRRLRNRWFRTQARTYIKRARAQIDAGELEEAKVAVAQATLALDKATERGIIHKNNAARRKSRIMRHLNRALQAAEA
ncbi:MAG TPA: 30S ribosomal protein S20 [Anaerolineae bacterium]|nr:30S ribosomal protein S20 [Anaerolineae bacterium]